MIKYRGKLSDLVAKILLFLLLMIIGVFFTFLSSKYMCEIFGSNYETTVGMIKSRRWSSTASLNNRGNATLYSTYSYTVDGEVYEVIAHGIRYGDNVKVRYKIDKPRYSIVVIEEILENGIVLICGVASISGAIPLLLYGIIGKKRKKRKDIKRNKDTL